MGNKSNSRSPEKRKPELKYTFSSHKESVFTVCFSPDQTKLLCYAGEDRKVIIANLQNYKTQKVFTGHEEAIIGSDFSSNGKFLATSSSDKTILIWNVESENGNFIKLEGHSGSVLCVRFFRNDSMKVISSSHDYTIKIWDIEQKKEISTLKGCKGSVLSVDILPDNQTIVSGDFGKKLRIWDIRSGKCVKILDQHYGFIQSVQFHPNSFSLASGSHDQTIKIFDFRTFELLQNYQEHSYGVRSVSFHPSGKFLVSGSEDTTIKLFDLSQKKVIYTLKEHSSIVNSVQFSPDGKSFASGSYDSKVLLWNFPLGRKAFEEKLDEEERVKYLIQQVDGKDEDDCCERFVLKIKIDKSFSLYSYKIFFVE